MTSNTLQLDGPSNRPELSPSQEDTAGLIDDLLGKAVAARYEDFCRLSTGAFGLQVSKPLAAHALRELDSMLRGILAGPLGVEASEAPMEEEKREGARKLLKGLGYDDTVINRAIGMLSPRTNHKDQIRRILTRLGFEADGYIVHLWIGIVDNYQVAHSRSFHKRMDLDADFITKLQQPFDIIIREVMIALRGHYATFLRRIAELVAMPDRGHAVALFFREIPGAMQLQWAFFNNLLTDDWLEPLQKQRLLGEPLTFDGDETGGQPFGQWPAGSYLLRMAKSNEALTRQHVVEALRAVAEVDHPEVGRGCISILAALPPKEVVSLSSLAVGWIRRSKPELDTPAPTDLINNLAEAGEGGAALMVAREAFCLWDDEGVLKTRYSNYMYGHYLQLIRPKLTTASGSDALQFFSQTFRQAVTIEDQSAYRYRSNRYVSDFGTPSFDVNDVLLRAVCETSEQLVHDHAVTMDEVLSILTADSEEIFKRLALHVLAQDPASSPELATAYLLDESLSTQDWCNLEYAALARAWFPALSAKEKSQILEAIDAVPGKYLARWKTSFEAQSGAPPSHSNINDFFIQCRQDLLWEWRSVLPNDRREQVEEAGNPNAWLRVFEAGDENAAVSTALSGKSIADIIGILKKPMPLLGNSRSTVSALAEEVRAAAVEQPEGFSAAADQFVGLRLIYIRRLLEGLVQACVSKPLDWSSCLRLIGFVYRASTQTLDTAALVDDDDQQWTLTCRFAGELLALGLRLPEELGICPNQLEVVRSLIAKALALAPSSTKLEALEEQSEQRTYFTFQQTLRGTAVELYVYFVHWRNLSAGPGNRTSMAAISSDPELSEVFQTQLDDRSIEGRIPRVIIGRHLSRLFHNDEEWVRSQMPALLPADDETLRQASWASHLMNDNGPISGLMQELEPSYANEVSSIIDQPWRPASDLRQQRLTEYIMVLVLRGSMPGGLLVQFLDGASAELLHHGMLFIGRQVSARPEVLPVEMIRRGQAYWIMRLNAAKASSDPGRFRRELEVIHMWCFLRSLDELWLADQMLEMLSIGLISSGWHQSIDWLAALSSRYIDVAVEILFGYVQDARTSRWISMTHQAQVRAILSTGRDSGTPQTIGRVSRIVSYLAAAGDPSYLDLDPI